MLQIVTGMYFRPVALSETLHRQVFYTNLRAFRAQCLEFVFGTLLISTGGNGVSTMTVETTERLEAVTPEGGREALISTSGDQLFDEIGAVISFALNLVFVRDQDMARRLIAGRAGDSHQAGPGGILRKTFDANAVLTDEAAADLDTFARALLALNRKSYEAAMRAIRQIVDAMLTVGEDATLAYTLMVAALESLAQSTEPPPAIWADFDDTKRARIDAATKGLARPRRERVEAAVLANEHVALQRRFAAFVLDHVGEAYYRGEAIDAIRPIPAAELPGALRQAYAIRSRNVHALEALAPEVWMGAQRSDTAHLGADTVLSLEGLARLSRHVVRQFVARAPTDLDRSFQYRSALPGIVRMRVAPQHWIFQAEGFGPSNAAHYLDGMLSFLIEGISGRSEAGLVDMSAVLARIEKIAPGLSQSGARLGMAAIMTLWNHFAPVELRHALRPGLAKCFAQDLDAPSMTGFAIKMVVGKPVDWPDAALEALARERRVARTRRRAQPLPSRIDAALHILLADRLIAAGRGDAGIAELAHAVETVPGCAELIAYEAGMRCGEDPALDLHAFVLGKGHFLCGDGADPSGPEAAVDSA